MLAAADDADVVVMAAAVADFRPEGGRRPARSRRTTASPEIVLEPTPDILADLGAAKPAGPGRSSASRPRPTTCVANAAGKLARKRLDLIVANDVVGARRRLRARHQRGRHPRRRRRSSSTSR